MKLHFLGTGSNTPTVRRGVSATAVQHDDGSVWLFDCGEGTQIQFQRSKVSCHKVTNIFITHLHGDHLFGLPGLLCTKSSQTQTTPNEAKKKRESSVVNIYGPEGIHKYVTTSLALSHSLMEFQFRIHELIPEPEQEPEEVVVLQEDSNERVLPLLHNQLPGNTIRATTDQHGNKSWFLIDDKYGCVEAGLVHHRVPTFGYVIREREKQGTLKIDVLKALGISPGPVYGKLKAGQCVTTEDGRKVEPKDVLSNPIPGRTLVIIGDTMDATPLSHLIKGCDVLVHEATLDNSLREKAKEHGHSTPSQAVSFAISVEAKTLLLNHFSQRYFPPSDENTQRGDSTAVLQNQAEEAAADSDLHVKCVEDFFVYEIPIRCRDCILPTDNISPLKKVQENR